MVHPAPAIGVCAGGQEFAIRAVSPSRAARISGESGGPMGMQPAIAKQTRTVAIFMDELYLSYSMM
jgi:hypothetical protein